MSGSRTRRTALAACAALLALALVCPTFPAFSQAPAATHEVRPGDTLFAIARKFRPDGVTLNQMLLAIYRANPEAFAGGNINRLIVGRVLAIPGRDQALAVPPAEALRQVQELIARPAALPPPAEKKEAPPKPPVEAVPAKPPTEARLSREEAARRYRDGLALEKKGDEHGALKAFLEAGENGHGPAQKHLGEIFDKGNSAVARDYETALRWYQRAREQGEAIPKPFVRSPR